jgi:hypothetical protein
MTDTNQKQLGNTLWSIADQLRGAMDADDFRDYMLSFLFLRYLPDNYETAAKKELGKDYPFYVCDLSTELWQGIPSNHFRGVMKMIPQVITQRNPAARFYQRSSSQGILDHSNRRWKRVTEDSSATARSVEQGLFTARSQGNRQGILDGSNRTDAGGNYRGILGSSKGAPPCCRTILSSAFLHPLP